MSRIKWVTVIVFNAGEFTGNIFHEFSDGFIPSSSLSIQSSPDQDVVLMISKALDWCVNKYTEILRAVTKYFIINPNNYTIFDCFPLANESIISHGLVTIDPKLIPN